MSAASRYWLLIGFDAAGRRKVREIDGAQAFFTSRFPDADREEVSDVEIQQKLWRWWQNFEAGNESGCWAEVCLRCFISGAIEQVCIQLETSFGNHYNFTREDLFPFVLNDTISLRPGTVPNGFTSFACEVLAGFNPNLSSLGTWTTKLVRQNSELRNFLVERGIYLVSDWAILNDTKPEKLRRVLDEFHNLSAREINLASCLLESYHAIYRRDRRSARKSRTQGQCPLPTREQLQQIANLYYLKTHQNLQGVEVMNNLQNTAELLREYRIYIKSGLFPISSLDNGFMGDEDNLSRVEQIPYPEAWEMDNEEDAEFLEFYREQVIACLDKALQLAISNRITALQGQNSDAKAEQFQQALKLYHCEGKSMGEIAQIVGLKAQFQVTRLLRLKQLRAEVKQLILKDLIEIVVKKAIAYTEFQTAKALEQKIERIIDEQVGDIVRIAEAESSTAKGRPLKSLFARRVCKLLCEKDGLIQN
jgi:hypothetical protein